LSESESPEGAGGSPLKAGRPRHRERRELETFRQAARRWSEKLERVRQQHEDSATPRETEQRDREHLASLERVLAEKDAELRALRSAAAERELDLQRDHAAESRRQREEIASLKKRLAESEAASGGARDEELREVKRLAYERESELRRASAEKLSGIEQDSERRLSALRAQREADNRSLIERHVSETAARDEEIQSLRLRRLSEARVYGERIEELARERAEERTSLEEAVAKLREKHEAERARLRDRVEALEEELEEQESITVDLLEELGYLQGGEVRHELSGPSESPSPADELEVAHQERPRQVIIRNVLRELREARTPGDLLREGLALFNDSEHVKVMAAVCKSLGEPEVHAELEDRLGTTTITLIWTGLVWRRYVSEPRAAEEPKVYLASYGDGGTAPLLPEPGPNSPNARLDARGLLALGVRPL
jgi:hypothetical protein